MTHTTPLPAAWEIYQGLGESHDGILALPDPPPWRNFRGAATDVDAGGPVTGEAPVGGGADTPVGSRPGLDDRARAYRPSAEVREMVNTALLLRRPLLVTGAPGTGKSTLAYSVAWELRLGRVLAWSVNSRSTLADVLYRYDALGRLQDVNVGAGTGGRASDVGDYVRLGPVGTALLPSQRTRVLLVDEFDKCDPDLPNELLAVLEDGEFEIPELIRDPAGQHTVRTADPDGRTDIIDGTVRCEEFPLVIITSNGEQDFPSAFLRRCLRVEIPLPDADQLDVIVSAQLGPDAARAGRPLIADYLARLESGDLVAADQLLNAVFLVTSREAVLDADALSSVGDAVLRPIGRSWQ